MLEWKEIEKVRMICAESNASPTGAFRIAYDDTMYWPSWSKDCTQNLEELKKEAQQLHDEYNKQ